MIGHVTVIICFTEDTEHDDKVNAETKWSKPKPKKLSHVYNKIIY